MTKRAPRHPVYKAWWAMIYRCYQEHHPLYPRYGARGIQVCDRWRNSCETFMADMLPTWKSGLTLEREDVNGGYSPENCRWATYAAQSRNTTRSRLIQTDFALMHWADAEDFYELPRGTIRHRVLYKWPEKYLLMPPGTHKKNLPVDA